METSMMLMLSFAHVVISLVVTAINVGVTQMRHQSTVDRDCRRVRELIRAELLQLASLHSDNLLRLCAGTGYILSSRACTAVYKGNMSKLACLLEVDIPLVVAAYAASEKAEHLIAATTKAQGSMVYKAIDGETCADLLMFEIQAALTAVKAASAALSLISVRVPTVRRPVSVHSQELSVGGVETGDSSRARYAS